MASTKRIIIGSELDDTKHLELMALGTQLVVPVAIYGSTGVQAPFTFDGSNQLKVTGSLTVGGTTDNSAFTAGTSTGTPAMGFYHSTIDAVTDGDAAAIAIDAKRNQFVVIRDAAGNARGLNIDASGQLAVTVASGTITTVSTVTNLAQMNGAAISMGTGIMGTGVQRVAIASDNDPLTVKQATAGNLNATVVGTGTFVVQATLAAETTKAIGVVRTSDGAGNLLTSNSTTYTAKFALDGNLLGTLGTAFSTAGKVDVKAADGDVFVRQATGTNLHMVVDSGTVTTVSTVTSLTQFGGTNIVTAGVSGMLAVGGNTATNVALTANPLNNGAQAVSAENTAVTATRGVQLVADLVGKLITLPYANPENFTMGTTAAITDTTSTSTIAAQGAGIRTYITQITVSNSHATVGTFVKILDGATIVWEAYCAAAGGGATATFPVPLRCTANTAVNTQPVTTGANVIATVSGYKGV